MLPLLVLFTPEEELEVVAVVQGWRRCSLLGARNTPQDRAALLNWRRRCCLIGS
jgi:hypothetical protein